MTEQPALEGLEPAPTGEDVITQLTTHTLFHQTGDASRGIGEEVSEISEQWRKRFGATDTRADMDKLEYKMDHAFRTGVVWGLLNSSHLQELDADGSPVMIPVHRGKLVELLQALTGEPHLMRELQVLSQSKLPSIAAGNPINVLIDNYNAWAHAHNETVTKKAAAKAAKDAPAA